MGLGNGPVCMKTAKKCLGPGEKAEDVNEEKEVDEFFLKWSREEEKTKDPDEKAQDAKGEKQIREAEVGVEKKKGKGVKGKKEKVSVKDEVHIEKEGETEYIVLD